MATAGIALDAFHSCALLAGSCHRAGEGPAEAIPQVAEDQSVVALPFVVVRVHVGEPESRLGPDPADVLVEGGVASGEGGVAGRFVAGVGRAGGFVEPRHVEDLGVVGDRAVDNLDNAVSDVAVD